MTLQKKNLFVSTVGVLFGLVYTISGLMQEVYDEFIPTVVMQGIILTLLTPVALHLYTRIVHEKIISPLVQMNIGKYFYKYETYSYAVFLLSLAMLAGVKPSITFTLMIWLSFILIQLVTFLISLDQNERIKLAQAEKYIALLFMISGFSALIYQIVWQRTLFTTFGVNSESVTIIVSVFMFGLGIGSLAGGYIQKKYPFNLLKIFLFLEISIGIFGLFSLDIIQSIRIFSHAESSISLVIWVYLILALPTFLMGATLPILISYLQKYFHNIGKTVGLLYAFNTIGSAIAAIYTVEILFVYFGQQTTILVAVACNLLTAYLIFNASKKMAVNKTDATVSLRFNNSATEDIQTKLPFSISFIALLAIGFISLSQEILWYRLLGFMTANKPEVFGLLLAAFLIGIAKGALKSKSICESTKDPHAYLVRALVYATPIFYLAVPFIANTSTVLNKEAAQLLGYFFIALVAYLTGGILPMLIQLGMNNRKSESTLSATYLYCANILGASLGPLITGFVLLDQFTLEQNIVIISGVTLILLIAIALYSPKAPAYKYAAPALLIVTGLIVWFAHPYLYNDYLEKIQYGTADFKPFKYKIENRSGIITIEADSSDIMYGNGIYDGRFNINPVSNSNMIDRAYMIAALHPHPKNILEIGLSTGSWTKVFSSYTPVNKSTVVEINKGYPAIIKHYPEISSILNDGKINLIFDDGRRWLNHHPKAKFDLIVMNTSFFWRSNSTNLLSKEFLELCKQHLNDGGVMYYNTTSSPDVAYTAAKVFKHVTMYINFVAASDTPFTMSSEEKIQNLLNFKDYNRLAIFDTDDQHRLKLIQLAKHELKDIGQEMRSRKDLWLVTDDNMAVEFKASR